MGGHTFFNFFPEQATVCQRVVRGKALSQFNCMELSRTFPDIGTGRDNLKTTKILKWLFAPWRSYVDNESKLCVTF